MLPIVRKLYTALGEVLPEGEDSQQLGGEVALELVAAVVEAVAAAGIQQKVFGFRAARKSCSEHAAGRTSSASP
jgi:hypothetical protein